MFLSRKRPCVPTNIPTELTVVLIIYSVDVLLERRLGSTDCRYSARDIACHGWEQPELVCRVATAATVVPVFRLARTGTLEGPPLHGKVYCIYNIQLNPHSPPCRRVVLLCVRFAPIKFYVSPRAVPACLPHHRVDHFVVPRRDRQGTLKPRPSCLRLGKTAAGTAFRQASYVLLLASPVL